MVVRPRAHLRNLSVSVGLPSSGQAVGRGRWLGWFLWPTLLSAPEAATGPPECSSPFFVSMLREKGPSPANGTTVKGAEDPGSFVTIRLPLRNQGDRMSFCHIPTCP